MENDNETLVNMDFLVTNEKMINTDNNNLANFVNSRNIKYSKSIIQNLLEYILIVSFLFNISTVSSNEKNTIVNNSYYEDMWTLRSINKNFKMFQNTLDVMNASRLAKKAFEEQKKEETSKIDLYCKKLYFFLKKEKLTLDQFSDMLKMMTVANSPLGFNYRTELDAFLDICFKNERSYSEKMLITMVRDGISYDELDTVCAGCVSESIKDGSSYEECYAVASTLINRSHMDWCINNYGTSIYDLFTAPHQYSVYPTKGYKNFLGCIDLSGYQAAIDAFYTREPSHEYLQFRANYLEVASNYEIFVDGGNKFFDKIQDSEYVPYEELVFEDEESMRLALETTIKKLMNKAAAVKHERLSRLSLEMTPTKHIDIK